MRRLRLFASRAGRGRDLRASGRRRGRSRAGPAVSVRSFSGRPQPPQPHRAVVAGRGQQGGVARVPAHAVDVRGVRLPPLRGQAEARRGALLRGCLGEHADRVVARACAGRALVGTGEAGADARAVLRAGLWAAPIQVARTRCPPAFLACRTAPACAGRSSKERPALCHTPLTPRTRHNAGGAPVDGEDCARVAARQARQQAPLRLGPGAPAAPQAQRAIIAHGRRTCTARLEGHGPHR